MKGDWIMGCYAHPWIHLMMNAWPSVQSGGGLKEEIPILGASLFSLLIGSHGVIRSPPPDPSTVLFLPED